MNQPHSRVRESIVALARIWRTGGSARIALPDPQTGELLACEVDHRAAEKIVAWLLDRVVAELLERKQGSDILSKSEAMALQLWHTQVPHAYDWSAPLGGPSLLSAVNVAGRPINVHEQKIVLAAHPAEYAIGWCVPKGARRAPGFRGHINIHLGSWGRSIFIARIDFPPNADLLTAWTQFDHLNVEKAVQRLSARDRRHHLLPYGMWSCSDGHEVLFNRNYEPIYERQPGQRPKPFTEPDARIRKKTKSRWFYFDGHTEAQKGHRATCALALFLDDKPVPTGSCTAPPDAVSKRKRR